MFNGRDYHFKFEEACNKLAVWAPENEVRSELAQLEWILWEAIRSVFFLAAIVPSLAVSALLANVLLRGAGWIWNASFVLVATAMLATIGYWFFRFAFWAEVTRYVRGRSFGR